MSTAKNIVDELIPMERMGLDPFTVSIRTGRIPVEDVLHRRDLNPKLSVLLAIADVAGMSIQAVPTPPPFLAEGTHPPRIEIIVTAAVRRLNGT